MTAAARTPRLTPTEVRDELRDRMRGATSDAILSFARGRTAVRLSDGTTVRRLQDAGWLELDGTRMYSAAWL